MALVTITRKTSVLQGYQLVAPADMVAALTYLSTRGYTGSISCYNNSGTIGWSLSLQNTAGTGAQAAVINDWVVIENDSIATLVPAAKAAALYQTS